MYNAKIKSHIEKEFSEDSIDDWNDYVQSVINESLSRNSIENPELSALASSIKGNEEAFDWLMKRNFRQYAAFSNAIDGDEKAWIWLKKHKFDFLIKLAEASVDKKDAMEWLIKNQLQVFAVIAKRIKDIKDQLGFDYEDYHKIHF